MSGHDHPQEVRFIHQSMNLEHALHQEDTSALEAYLNPSLGSYSEKDLEGALAALQGRLRQMGLPPLGDLYRPDTENLKTTLRCLSELLNRVVLSQDKGGASVARLTKLNADYKILQTQLEKVNAKKKVADQEIQMLGTKVKKLENEMAEKKKAYDNRLAEFEAEKSTWDNKYKQFGNELRKKDNVIKKYTEMLENPLSKDTRAINGVEVIGDLTRPGSKFYGPNEPYSEFMSFCNDTTRDQFNSLRKENDHMREQLSEINQMMGEIIKVRKAVVERRLYDQEGQENKVMVQIRQELLNLRESDLEVSGLQAIKENMKRFRDYMDKIDSANFGIPLEKAYQFSPEADIDEIKNIKKLKDLISRQQLTRKLQIRRQHPGPVDPKGHLEGCLCGRPDLQD